ncbi:MAG: cytochrome P450 [Cyanobacteria bacterium J06576_12]
MPEAQVSKCPFHTAQQLFSKQNHVESAEASSAAQTSTAKTIPHSKLPKLLQAAQWALNPVGYVQKNVARHGDVFRAPVTTKKSYCLLSDPKAIQYLLTHDTGKVISAPGELNFITAPLIGKKNVIGFSGKQHQQRRKIIMPPTRPRNCVETYSKVIQEVTQAVIDQWQTGDTVDVRIEMQKITFRVILRVVLGLKQGKRAQRLEHLLTSLLNMVGTPLSSLLLFVPWLRKDVGAWSPGGRIRLLRQEIDELLIAEIEDRRAEHHPSEEMDVLSLLLAATDDAGNPLSNEDLKGELMMSLVAGFEATTVALTWAVYWTHFLPEVKQNLLTALNDSADAEDVNKLLSLPYLTAVCNETLRINPVAMLTFARRVEAPLNIGGYQFSPGDLVMGSIYSLHRREDLYPQPHRFRPERFLERTFSPYEFMPFGGGMRRCMGSALAQCEMKIVLATILRQVDLSLVGNHPIKPARRGIVSGPKSPVRVKVMKKHSGFS